MATRLVEDTSILRPARTGQHTAFDLLRSGRSRLRRYAGVRMAAWVEHLSTFSNRLTAVAPCGFNRSMRHTKDCASSRSVADEAEMAEIRAAGPARRDRTTALRIASKRALDLNCRVAYGSGVSSQASTTSSSTPDVKAGYCLTTYRRGPPAPSCSRRVR